MTDDVEKVVSTFLGCFQSDSSTGVKLDGKSIWKIHMDFFFENPFFLNLF